MGHQALLAAPTAGCWVVSDRSYLSQNLPAGYELWRTADLVIGIGSRMEHQYLHWGVADSMAVVRIDTDATEIARHRAPAVALTRRRFSNRLLPIVDGRHSN